jgi:hypothetical protein
MSTSRRIAPRLGESMRRKLEVTSAMAWEALVEVHVEQATHFVSALAGHWPLEETLPRYLREMDLDETMATAIRTRVLTEIEATGPDGRARLRPDPHFADDVDLDDGDNWNLLRRGRGVVRDVLARQRRNDEIDRIVLLSLARAEENVIRTHVENAIGFVALLQEMLTLDEAVEQYLGAVRVVGSRAQAVMQRTMARLADVHLPLRPA